MSLPSYYSPRISSEVDDCSLPLTFDSYSRCSLGCRYCFSNSQKDNNPVLKGAPLQGVDVKHILSLIDGTATNKEGKLFHEYFFKKRFIFHWGGLADPFCHVEKKHGIGYTLLKELADRKYPTLFSFKGPLILEDKYLQLFDDYKDQQSFAFQTSIVTADDELAKYVEPGVPSPTQRFQAMKTLADMGYWTILRMRPFIIGVTDLSLDEILHKGLESGMGGISTELYAVDSRSNNSPWAKRQFAEMGKLTGAGNLHSYYSTLSPPERGGYMRLNIKVKERSYKKMYKFCSDHNLVFSVSDPDGKNMGTSPCCCGLPEVNTRNKEFENFTTNQMTAAMIKARRLYHTTGEKMKFYFHEVYGNPEDHSFLNDIELSHQNCGCTSHNYAYRKRLTQLLLLQRKWNNLRSSSNVSNYFHGNLVPIGLSEDKLNLVYQYHPYAFEDRWAAEGIDMGR